MTNLTNLDIYFQRMKSMNKKFVIPDIQRINAKGGVGGKTTKTSRQDYESEIRSHKEIKDSIKYYYLTFAKVYFLSAIISFNKKCEVVIFQKK